MPTKARALINEQVPHFLDVCDWVESKLAQHVTEEIRGATNHCDRAIDLIKDGLAHMTAAEESPLTVRQAMDYGIYVGSRVQTVEGKEINVFHINISYTIVDKDQFPVLALDRSFKI